MKLMSCECIFLTILHRLVDFELRKYEHKTSWLIQEAYLSNWTFFSNFTTNRQQTLLCQQSFIQNRWVGGKSARVAEWVYWLMRGHISSGSSLPPSSRSLCLDLSPSLPPLALYLPPSRAFCPHIARFLFLHPPPPHAPPLVLSLSVSNSLPLSVASSLLLPLARSYFLAHALSTWLFLRSFVLSLSYSVLPFPFHHTLILPSWFPSLSFQLSFPFHR